MNQNHYNFYPRILDGRDMELLCPEVGEGASTCFKWMHVKLFIKVTDNTKRLDMMIVFDEGHPATRRKIRTRRKN